MKMICLVCGNTFNSEESPDCPICKNDNMEMLLKSIIINECNIDKNEIICDENIKNEIEKKLKETQYSSAYIKLCAKKLEEDGLMYLSFALDQIALRKQQIESKLFELCSFKNDFKKYMDYVIIRAKEDVNHSNLIMSMCDDKVKMLMEDLLKKELENLHALEKIFDIYIFKKNEIL